MRIIVVDEKKKNSVKQIEYRLNLFVEWLIYMLGYAIILLFASNLFRSLYVENFLYGFISAIIIYILNKTIKPLLITITLPLIGLSLGLFYFVINVIILLIVDLLLGSHFNIYGVASSIIIAMFISLANILLDNLIIKPLIEVCKK